MPESVTLHDALAAIRGRLTRLVLDSDDNFKDDDCDDSEPRWVVTFPDAVFPSVVMDSVELEALDEIGELSCVFGATGGEDDDWRPGHTAGRR